MIIINILNDNSKNDDTIHTPLTHVVPPGVTACCSAMGRGNSQASSRCPGHHKRSVTTTLAGPVYRCSSHSLRYTVLWHSSVGALRGGLCGVCLTNFSVQLFCIHIQFIQVMPFMQGCFMCFQYNTV